MARFRERDVRRAVRSVESAGKQVTAVEIASDGKIIVIVGKPTTEQRRRIHGTTKSMARIKLRYVNSFYDRHGRLRHLFRYPGCKRFTLPGLPGSAEFMEAYQNALAHPGIASSTEIGSSRTKSGTIDAAIAAYYKSDAFTESLAAETQRMRRHALERFLSQHGDKRIRLLREGEGCR